MKTTDPFSRGVLTASELYRQTRNPLETALSGTLSHADNLKRLMEQAQGPLRLFRQMQGDPFRSSVDTALRLARQPDGLRHTLRAIEEAQKQREQFARTLAGSDLMRTRTLASAAFDTGVLRTAEVIRRNTDTIAAAIAATRPAGDMAHLASSVMRSMDALRLTGLRANGFPKSAAQQFAEHYSQARQVAEELGEAETEEQRVALLARLIALVAAAMRSVTVTKRDAVLGLTIVLAVIGLAADVKSLLPSEPPPGMAPAQVRMLEDTRRDVDTLLTEFGEYRESERVLDEASVADHPRAELHRPAIMRTEPRREGKALFRAPAGTLLAIAGTQGRWKHVVYRDPLTDRLAIAWVYGAAVTPLDPS